jgi:2,4-dienoyl-CoA reductase (NADPH2)
MPETFEHLLSPLQVGPKLLRNRVLISAHVPRLAVDNLPAAAYIAYHRVRARGGAGLQITGATAVHPTGTLGTPDSLENLDDRIVPGYRQLADAVHGEGGTILAQLAHSAATLNVSDAGRPLWAPSPVQSELARETPHEMTRDDIAEIIAAYRAAALRVREGGLDGVELLAAFGFLIAAFLSPLTNKREDAYGGSADKRLRFALEVVSAVREAVGPERILGLRIPVEEGCARSRRASPRPASSTTSTSSSAPITAACNAWPIGGQPRWHTASMFLWPQISNRRSGFPSLRPAGSPNRSSPTPSSGTARPTWWP